MSTSVSANIRRTTPRSTDVHPADARHDVDRAVPSTDRRGRAETRRLRQPARRHRAVRVGRLRLLLRQYERILIRDIDGRVERLAAEVRSSTSPTTLGHRPPTTYQPSEQPAWYLHFGEDSGAAAKDSEQAGWHSRSSLISMRDRAASVSDLWRAGNPGRPRNGVRLHVRRRLEPQLDCGQRQGCLLPPGLLGRVQGTGRVTAVGGRVGHAPGRW
ncbi:MAG: hypothetical protein QOF76_2855 [Solirubrobacteraceae bacterium]|nr:hypothetical protein [Solirubrobacteraceae bacterium]